MKADIVVRQQRAKRGKSGFHGPDTYVALVVRGDDGVPVGSLPLSEHNIKRHGWSVERFGEGYREHCGPRSSLGLALAMARARKEELER